MGNGRSSYMEQDAFCERHAGNGSGQFGRGFLEVLLGNEQQAKQGRRRFDGAYKSPSQVENRDRRIFRILVFG
ncbi:hypothetical protein SPHINGO391_360055 [Sphingomonas aurantiaca]|uniref:Uncharacterized protein n=1 Tax=Sphingomonas aurantiaca TaxID=185949 RepID=A0A5E7YDH5_9SPHN|nr:hypothetical protein SPHINGO391_360055 [Sphingomonas aurantiaca]